MGSFLLSKSRFMQALHCERRAWLAANHPELKAPNSRGLELRLQQGQQIGRIAHQLFPGGSFPTGSNDAEFATATVKLLENKSPIYEGVFLAKNCSARVDILTPNEAGWTLVEVKSSTRVKPEHIQDIAFQAWVAKESGVTIQKFAVAHINSGFRLRAELDDPWEFFEVVDVTPDVMEALSELPPLIEGLSGIFADVEPSTEPGLHCRRPDRCAFYDHCHQEIPPNDTRFFPGIGQEQIDALRARGQVTIEQVEAINRLTAVQSRAIKAAKEKKTVVDEKLKATLKRFSHPLAFVDFEAFNSGIPILPGSKPYQAIPFQWSVHLVQGPGQHTSHVGFLHKGMNDPRDRFVETLELATRSANGIVHYSPYELQLLKCMAEDGVPGAGSLYNRFAEKSLDLLKIIRENVYDINFQSSFSLKVVLASLLPGLDYSGLAVQDGDSAAAAYLAFFTGSLSQEEAEQTLSDLEKYCKYDTWAMARVFDRLVELAAD